MARAPFSIIERKTSAGRVYVARFFTPEGKIVRSKSFPKARSRTQAARLADAFLQEGVIAHAANPDALEYLKNFWTETSDYVKGRALRGIELSEAYLAINRYIIGKHIKPNLKGKRLLGLNTDFIEGLILSLSEGGNSPKTINSVINAIRVPMRYFCKRNKVINPLGPIEMLTENPRERGVLSLEELRKIIELEGESPRVKAGVLMGGLCGLRLGEVCGSMPEDIDRITLMLNVQHNVPGAYKSVKGPKGSRVGHIRARQVPIPEPLMSLLNICASLAPTGAKFCLWNEKDASKPIHPRTLQNGYKRILGKIGIEETERKQRNLVFHGLRGTFISLSRVSGTPDFITARESGHKSAEMLDVYSRGANNLIDFQALRIKLEKTISEVDCKAL